MTSALEAYKNFMSSGYPSFREMFLLRSAMPLFLIISSYVLFVTQLGPALMKNRKPITLRRVMVAYNFSLVVWYVFFLLRGMVYVYQLGFSAFCDSTLSTEDNPLVEEFFWHGYSMYIVRYIELLDTVFLVLSKKFKMITPLHVFHHSIVPIFGFFGFRSEKSAYLAVFMGVNSFVHVIMYTYYGIAALGPQFQSYIWWKKYLTSLQILQFLVITFYLLIMSAIGCVTSKVILYFSLVLSVVFFILFLNYYRRTFVESRKKNLDQNGASSVQAAKSLKNKSH